MIRFYEEGGRRQLVQGAPSCAGAHPYPVLVGGVSGALGTARLWRRSMVGGDFV